MEEPNQNQTVQEQVPAEQIESKFSLFKNLRRVGLILFSFLILLIFIYMFLATPREAQGKPIKPFYYGQRMLAEKVSYLFIDPKEGDRVLFKADDTRMDFFGVITAIENKNNILTYKIVSSNPSNPWIVTRDKIIGKIYYPFMKNEEVLKIISSQLPTPTPSPNPDSIETWRTYTNEKFGFSFKYPSNIISTEDDTNVIIVKDTKGIGLGNMPISYIGVLIVNKDGTLPANVIGEGNINYHKWRFNESNTLLKMQIGESKTFDPGELIESIYKRLPDTLFAGSQSKTFLKTNPKEYGDNPGEKIIYPESGDYRYIITFSAYRNYGESYDISPELFDQILSTFKFTQ